MIAPVPNRLPLEICVGCRKPIGVGEALVQVFTVAGIESHVLHSNGAFEAAHFRCASPTLSLLPKHHLSRHRLRPGDPPPVDARAPDFQCLTCGKIFQREDRIVLIYRTEGPAIDPMTKQPAMRVTAGHECAHYDCADPKKQGTGPLLLGGS